MDKWSHKKENSRFCAAKIGDTVHEALAILNKDLLIVFANKAFCSLFDTTKSNIENHNLFELNDISNEGQELKKLFEKTASNGDSVENYELVICGADRENKLLFSIRNINEPGEEKLILVVIEDITKSLANEAYLRKFEKTRGEIEQMEVENRTKNLNDDLRKHISELQIINDELESFSYSVSHDLKSPLNVISGFSQLIIDQYSLQLDPELVGYLYRILSSTKKMNILINDLLTLSRISKTEMRIEKINLSEMVTAFLTDLQLSEPQRHAEFSVQKGIEVQADRRLLHLAIENLLSNAWKYCSKEEITRISFGTVLKNGTVTYYTKDNGVGFDMKYAEKIFQPFQRLHSERDFKGTGIGLATVVRVLRRHNGHIWAEAEIGKGATFYFTLGTKV